MSLRVGPGPVFVCEWLRLSRRWQMFAVRSVFVFFLLAAIYLAWITNIPFGVMSKIRAQAYLGQTIFYAVTGVQIALVLLAAPAATAGAICLDKACGVL